MGSTDHGVSFLALVVIFWCLACASTALRLWSRRIKRQTLVFNDYAVIIAFVFMTAVAGLSIHVVVVSEAGRSIENVSAIAVTPTSIFVWLMQAFANTFARFSMLHLLGRIFPGPRFAIALKVGYVACTAYVIACFLDFFVGCRPSEARWNPTSASTCPGLDTSFMLTSVFNFVLDLMIIVLPLPKLWRLQMARNKKIALTAVFMTGVIVCAMTLLRLHANITFSTGGSRESSEPLDIFWVSLWSTLEPALSIVNCNLPLFPPAIVAMANSRLLARCLGRIMPNKPVLPGKRCTCGYHASSTGDWTVSVGNPKAHARAHKAWLFHDTDSPAAAKWDHRIQITNEWKLQYERRDSELTPISPAARGDNR